MACFLVPAAEAVVVTAAYFVAKKNEKKLELPRHTQSGELVEESAKFPLSKKLGVLLGMLWGGVLLLAFEHLWHGEITPFPPFLTAMNSPDNTAEMLREMSTVGVSMAVCVTAVWGVICAAISVKVKKLKSAAGQSA